MPRHYPAELRRMTSVRMLAGEPVKDLSAERQKSARQFAATLISQTRAELDRLLKEQPEPVSETGDVPCEPAD